MLSGLAGCKVMLIGICCCQEVLLLGLNCVNSVNNVLLLLLLLLFYVNVFSGLKKGE